MNAKADKTILQAGRFTSLFFVFLLSAIVSVFSSPNSVVSLHFRDSVMVRDTLIKVNDIAAVSSENSNLSEMVRASVAGSSAPAGYSRFLNADDLVMYRLKSQYQDVVFEISGNHRVKVSTDFVEKKIGDYLGEINEYLTSVISWPQGHWNVEIENPETSWKCLNSPVRVKAEGLQNGYPKGRTLLVLLVEQGNRQQKINVRCNFKVRIPVLVSSKMIQRGQPISSQDFEFKEMDITRFAPAPYTEADHIEGMRASRTINPGMILHDRMVQAIPAVDKGDRVQILLQKGRIKVAVSAIAREPGGIGDRIWVENTVSNKLVQVVVTGKGTVKAPQGGSTI